MLLPICRMLLVRVISTPSWGSMEAASHATQKVPCINDMPFATYKRNVVKGCTTCVNTTVHSFYTLVVVEKFTVAVAWSPFAITQGIYMLPLA